MHSMFAIVFTFTRCYILDVGESYRVSTLFGMFKIKDEYKIVVTILNRFVLSNC